jgi:hypothetical protein
MNHNSKINLIKTKLQTIHYKTNSKIPCSNKLEKSFNPGMERKLLQKSKVSLNQSANFHTDHGLEHGGNSGSLL